MGSSRWVMPDGQIGFVGKDVAEALGYSNASKAIIMHVDDDDKVVLQVYLDSQNGNAGQRRKTGGYIPVHEQESAETRCCSRPRAT